MRTCAVLLGVILSATLLIAGDTWPQTFSPTTTRAKVPPYTLPDPLLLANGQRVADAATWRNVRRPEILGLFEKSMYGKAPGRPEAMTFQLRSSADALDGKAVRKEVRSASRRTRPARKWTCSSTCPSRRPSPARVPRAELRGQPDRDLDPGITISERMRDTAGASSRQAPRQPNAAAGRWK